MMGAGPLPAYRHRDLLCPGPHQIFEEVDQEIGEEVAVGEHAGIARAALEGHLDVLEERARTEPGHEQPAERFGIVSRGKDVVV